MNHPDVLRTDQSARIFTNPWPSLFVGLGLILIAVVVTVLSANVLLLLPPLLLGTLFLGIAVAIAPRAWHILGLAAAGTLVGSLCLNDPKDSWDSLRLVLRVFAFVSFLAAILMVSPRTVRRVVVSLLVVLHFGGIFSAIMQVPPAPWIMGVVWTVFYRPYLQFMYLNNAYHFYAPEPGPGVLVWFQVKYEDGTDQWVKIPRREDYPLTVQYQRRLSLVESVNQTTRSPSPPHIRERRLLAAQVHRIPIHPEVAENMQYQEPNPYSKKMLAEYAKHVALTTPHPSDSSKAIKGIRIYRILHDIPRAPQIANRVDPTSPWMYFPYFQGEYDTAGNLKDPNDPYLYWLIPVLEKEVYHRYYSNVLPDVEETDPKCYDFFQKHVHMELIDQPNNRPAGDKPAAEPTKP